MDGFILFSNDVCVFFIVYVYMISSQNITNNATIFNFSMFFWWESESK